MAILLDTYKPGTIFFIHIIMELFNKYQISLFLTIFLILFFSFNFVFFFVPPPLQTASVLELYVFQTLTGKMQSTGA